MKFNTKKLMIRNSIILFVSIVVVIISYLLLNSVSTHGSNLEEVKVIGPGGGGALFNPAINPYDDTNVYLVTDMTANYVSHDSGVSFSTKNLMGISSFEFGSEDVIYAYNDYLHVSYDKGETFELLFPKEEDIDGILSRVDTASSRYLVYDESKGPKYQIIDLSVDSENPSLMYFITEGWGDNKANIYKSDDAGDSFSIIAEINSSDNIIINSLSYADIFIDPHSDVNNREVSIIFNDGMINVDNTGVIDVVNTNKSVAGDIYYDDNIDEVYYYVVSDEDDYSDDFSNSINVSNDGVSWKNIGDTFTNNLSSVAGDRRKFVDVAVANNNVIYTNYQHVGDLGNLQYQNLNFGVAVTNDGGLSWDLGLKGFDISNINEHSWIEYFFKDEGDLAWSKTGLGLTTSKGNSDMAIVTGYGNAYMTSDGGATWNDITTNYDEDTKTSSSNGVEPTGANVYAIDPFDSDHVLAGFFDIGLFESFDGGVTWKHKMGDGIPRGSIYTNTVYDIEFDPDIEGLIYVAFNPIHDLISTSYISKVYSMGLAATIDPTMEYDMSTGGISISSDGGSTWTSTGNYNNPTTLVSDDSVSGLPDKAIITDIALDPNSPSNKDERVIYVACMGFGVYKSIDGGRSFSLFSDGMTETVKMPFRFTWNSDFSRLYIISAPNGSATGNLDEMAFYPNEGKVYYLNIIESSWNEIDSMPTEGLPDNSIGLNYASSFNSLDIDSNGVLYASSRLASVSGEWNNYNYGGVWVSLDNGTTWRNIFNSKINVMDIRVDSRNDNVLYVTSNNGGDVYVSYKGAKTTEKDWIKLDDFDHMAPFRIFENPDSDTDIYVTTVGGGIWNLNLPKTVYEEYSINTDINNGGGISVVDKSRASFEIVFDIDLDEGYKLEEDSLSVYTVSGIEVELIKKDNTYSFIMPSESVVIFSRFTEVNNELNYMDLNYLESREHIDNPERGFYRTGIAWFEKEGANHTGYTNAPLVHLRVSMGYYNNVNGENDISANAINGLKKILDTYRKNGTIIILRFSYGDNPNMEPSMEQVLKHVEQLKPIFMEYEDIIMSLDTGLIGPWGEQHSSTIATPDNISKLVDAFLENTPSDMQISVRRPSYFTHWAGIDYNELHSYKAVVGSDAYRVGIYNDGYLGSHSDLGTFLYHPLLGWRENENRFFENHNTHTVYGGEVVTDGVDDNFAYNSSYYMSEEMFRTHTTYLNYEWNQSVINAWKNEDYEGTDYIYEGLSGYTYINNHLGYRYVLKSSYLSDVYLNDGNTLNLKGNILNVGAGNVVKPKKVELVFSNGSDIHTEVIDIDFRNILSTESLNYSLEVLLSKELDLGEYDVYMRIFNEDMGYINSSIKFANYDIYDDDIKGNYIGEINVTNKEFYDIKVVNSSFGDIKLSNNKAMEGDSVSFVVNVMDGYKIKDESLKILSNGKVIEYLFENGGYVFTMPNGIVDIELLFEEIKDIVLPDNDTDNELSDPEDNDDFIDTDNNDNNDVKPDNDGDDVSPDNDNNDNNNVNPNNDNNDSETEENNDDYQYEKTTKESSNIFKILLIIIIFALIGSILYFNNKKNKK